MTKPLCIDLYAGLGGWAEAFLAEDYFVVGFDIERHQYGEHRYPGLLVVQDVLTLHGSQFKDATLIVASPPCQAYSYRAMPWKRARALPPPDNTLFETCFRIQREASEAAGHKVPLIVENVRGAQKWVGRARWNFGSFYLWGDVPALMPVTFRAKQDREVLQKDGHNVILPQVVYREEAATKVGGIDFNGYGTSGEKPYTAAEIAHDKEASGKGRNPDGRKGIPHRTSGHWTNPAEHEDGSKGGHRGWFNDSPRTPDSLASSGSKSSARKMASAMIAKIPAPLARHIAATFKRCGHESSGNQK